MKEYLVRNKSNKNNELQDKKKVESANYSWNYTTRGYSVLCDIVFK